MNRVQDIHRFRADSFLALLSDPNLRLSYSQNGEDQLICELLAGVSEADRGIYVDVGCFHPRQFSNTFFLYYAGWRGLNIDANPTSIDLFRRERPLDQNICCAVGEEDGETDFHIMEPTAASTMLKEQAALCQEFGWKLVETIQVPVRTINSLLAGHVAPGTRIDLLDIDLEGMDERILLSLDFDRYRPRIVVAELRCDGILSLGGNAAAARLLALGYQLRAAYGGTFVFSEQPA